MRRSLNHRVAPLLKSRREHMIEVRFPDRNRLVKLLHLSGEKEGDKPAKITVIVPIHEREGLQTQYNKQVYLEQTLGTSTGQIVYTMPFNKVCRVYQDELRQLWNLQQAS